MENWAQNITRLWEGAKGSSWGLCPIPRHVLAMPRNCQIRELVLLKEVLLYLQRAWAGSSASASLVGHAAACDNVWLHSLDPGKLPKTLSTPHCQQHLADSWDGWRGGAPLPATLQRTVRGGKNSNTLQPSCWSSAAQHLCLLPYKLSPVTQPGKMVVMDAEYKLCPSIGWDRDNTALSAPWPRLVLVPGLKIIFKRWQLLLYSTVRRDFWNKSLFWTQAEYNTWRDGVSFRVFWINLEMWAWLLHCKKSPPKSFLAL